MTLWIILGVVGLVIVAGFITLIVALVRGAHEQEVQRLRAEKAERDAQTQTEYARIATERHDADTTAERLQRGEF